MSETMVGLKHYITRRVTHWGSAMGATLVSAERYAIPEVDTALLMPSDDRLFLQHADITCSHCGAVCRVGILTAAQRRWRRALLAILWLIAIGFVVWTMVITDGQEKFFGGSFILLLIGLFVAMVAHIYKDSLIGTLYLKGDFAQERHKVVWMSE